jgi:chromosomal replication initiator protein
MTNTGNEDVERVWNSVLSAIKTEVSEGSFNTYIKNLDLLAIDKTGEKWLCEVGCNSSFIKNTVEQRYVGLITREVSRITGKKCEAVLKVVAKQPDPVAVAGPLFEQKTYSGRESDIKRANLREDLSFENYAVAGSNQMAYAAAVAVAKKPGSAYNPLFIYGGVGVGKTHLMQAIGHALIKNGERSVLFCSGEEFTNDLVEAIRFKTTEKVRSKYRKVKLLLIDDVQFIAGKPSVQEEFFHTFNSIQKEGGQVVMTSDKPPAEISKLEERLRSRFGAGLIVDIGPADFELRAAILLIKSKQRGYEMTMEMAQTIAANIEGVRELQGFLIKLETEEKVRNTKLGLEEVKQLLNINGGGGGENRVITPNEVIAVVGTHFGVGVGQLKGERRSKIIAWPRQILMFLLRQELRLPLEEVGRLVGGRDHTTVLHAADKVRAELEQNHKFQAEMAVLKRKIFVNNL